MVSGPAHGTVVVNADGSFIHTEPGLATMATFKVNDGTVNSSVATVSLLIVAVGVLNCGRWLSRPGAETRPPVVGLPPPTWTFD